MVVSLAAWSLVVEPGKKITHDVFRDIKITNAALGATLEDEKARSTLKIFYTPPPTTDDEEEDEGEDTKKKSPQKQENENVKEVALCSLIPGSIEQATLDITFVEDDVVHFEVVGKNSIHLFGNYIDQDPMADMPPEDDYDEDDESVNLLDVSSDVEIDPAELDGLDDSENDENRFEELPDDDAVAGKKHGREEDDTMDGDVSMTSAKKLKDQSGSAVDTKSSKKEKKKGKKEQAKGEEADSSPAKSADKGASKEMKELSGGLKIKDVKTGSGKQAKAGNVISMRYIGKFPGGKVFDSNTKGEPFKFRLGKGEVIKGWDQGVAGMKVGGERLIIVPPSLGYGNKKTGDIPANSTLHFVESMQQQQEAEKTDEDATTLENYVTHLTSLLDRVNALRNQPSSLLMPSTFIRTEAEQGFEQINNAKTEIKQLTIQTPLKLAYDAFPTSLEDITISGARMLNRKRARPPSPTPESPRLAVATPDLIFPQISRPPLTVSELPSYIREHNKANFPSKIYIWTHARPDPNQPNKLPLLQDRITLRISILDVLYAYVRFEVEGADDEDIRMIGDVTKGKLMVETATVFGPRERKLPHSQSDFAVFQKISQHIAWLIQAQPEVELQNIVCTICHRILSEEGHFPPVCRIWTTSRKPKDSPISDEPEGKWEPRHRTCLSV
ncbi:hypothetical protein Clacol_000426 [Clathrus columnatus]|uniref:peptidylprolyl isomerase n=1 Tax=Clathrus columnatus TaxID=1419009 RepID=A0AAV4ZZP1_9AGAM|nr:hypothetical protein Clacol_000426 [Clathrus columnatus]